MKKVLICGATGFIGKNITLELSKNKNYKIHAVRHKRQKYDLPKNVIWHKADLRSPDTVDKLVKGMDIIIQCSNNFRFQRYCISMPYIHVTDNAIINSYMFRAAYNHKVKHFIFQVVQLCILQKNQQKKLTLMEKIINKYKGAGETKVYLEKIAKFYSMLSNTKYTIIRHSNIYGPHDKYDLDKSHVFGATITKVMRAKDTLKSGVQEMKFVIFFMQKIL